MFSINQEPIVKQSTIDEYWYIPIEVVEKLRHDPLWEEVIKHLEQGKLGLGIRYTDDVVKEEVKETEQTVRDEVKELKAEVKELKTKAEADAWKIEADVKNEVKKIGNKVNELKEEVKNGTKEKGRSTCRKARDTTKTTILVSKEFKQILKTLKGSRTYEELLREEMDM